MDFYFVTAIVKEDERRGQGHTSQQTCCISVACHWGVNTQCFLHECFSALCFVMSAMDGKMKQCVWIKICVKLGKSSTATHEMDLENILQSTQWFLNDIHVSRLIECQLNMTNV
jgi:hypothetical protein